MSVDKPGGDEATAGVPLLRARRQGGADRVMVAHSNNDPIPDGNSVSVETVASRPRDRVANDQRAHVQLTSAVQP